MQPLARRLPGLGALAVFECAARHGSFTRAAAELHVTQGAVSRQIKLLESRLGTALFRRGHRSVELTAQGRRYQQAVTMALEHIAGATEEIAAARDAASLTVAATLAVTGLWLMPRLAALRAVVPGVDVQVLATNTELEQVAGGYDVGIRYGTGGWPGLVATRLGLGEVFPVCSPGYLRARGGPLGAPSEYLGETLLHQGDARSDWIDWPQFLRRLGVRGTPPRPGLRADSYPLLVQAAAAGQGIALGWRYLVDGHLARGELVPAGPARLETGSAFHVVVRDDAPPSPARDRLVATIVEAFRDPSGTAASAGS